MTKKFSEPGSESIKYPGHLVTKCHDRGGISHSLQGAAGAGNVEEGACSDTRDTGREKEPLLGCVKLHLSLG